MAGTNTLPCAKLSLVKPVVIAGGGLAGLTLGVLLRRENVPVQIWDAASYPRHRVCGEFISGAGVELLRTILPELQTLAQPARSVRFFYGRRSTAPFELPRSAWSISRYKLDALLADRFRASGGELLEQTRWTESFTSAGVVRATGRRAMPQKGVSPKFVGLKIHARHLSLSADLELHFKGNSYLGLSRLPEGEVNICGLFENGACNLQSARTSYKELFTAIVAPSLRQELEQAEFDEESFCSVAALSLAPESASASDECRIGDSICMIPPLTGNGMSLAIESAFASYPMLLEYANGASEWAATQRAVARILDKKFNTRIGFAGALQNLLRRPFGRSFLMSTLKALPRLLQTCFYATRV